MTDDSNTENTLRKLLDRSISERYKNGTISIKSLTSGGANYTSSLYSITITAKNEMDLKLFAKVANVSDKLREAMNVKLKFDTELLVYTELATVYEKIQERHNVAPEYRLEFPKFYGSGLFKGEEIIILEDLVSEGYGSYSRFKSIDWEHMAIAVESLARFHALSFAFEKEDPENFAKVLERVTFHLPEKCSRAESWKKRMEEVVKVVKREHKEVMSKFLLNNLVPEELYKYKMPIGRTVLCHGDYRVSNLLFKRQNEHLTTKVLDYQTVHTGCAPVDLLFLEFMGTDEEFRRENHQKLIDHYYQELTMALDRLGLDVNDVYPREMFDNELKQMLPVTLRLASLILPWVLMEANHAPQLGKCEGLETIVVSYDQLFAERFNALVSDCVRWGVL